MEHERLARTASGIAADVRAGGDPTGAVRVALDRIAARDRDVGAFATVLRDQALADAEGRSPAAPTSPTCRSPGSPSRSRTRMPVRGVAPWSDPAHPARETHPVVDRLRGAGAVIVGTTTASDASLWPFTDGRAPDGRLVVTRNPWDLGRTAGGSSGGRSRGGRRRIRARRAGERFPRFLRIPRRCAGSSV